MLHVAIIGAGPAGFYAAEALARRIDVAIDVIEALPTPYGLIRAGVAPDHQSIKAVDRRYHAVLEGGVRFIGDVRVGEAVSVAELLELYDAVVLATGAPRDRPLGISGEDLPGVVGSAAFVGWYNGHPDFADVQVPLTHPHAVIIGNGNVALDCARVLAKAPAELATSDLASHARRALAASCFSDISIIGRRGPYQAQFTAKEIGELGLLTRAQPVVDPSDLPDPGGDSALDPGHRKVVGYLRAFAAAPRGPKPISVSFDFFTRPVQIAAHGDSLQLTVERTRIDGDRLVGTGILHQIGCGLIVSCIGYAGVALPEAELDLRHDRVINDRGRISDRLYVVGWARRGPSGTIGTNRPDAVEVADRILAEVVPADRAGGPGLDMLLMQKNIRPVEFNGWRAIDAAERAGASGGAPREKIVNRHQLQAAAHLAHRDADGGCAS